MTDQNDDFQADASDINMPDRIEEIGEDYDDDDWYDDDEDDFTDEYEYDDYYDDDDEDYYPDDDYPDELILTRREKIAAWLSGIRWRFFWWRVAHGLERCAWCGRIKRFGDHSKCIPF